MRGKFLCAGILALLISYVAAPACAQANHAAMESYPRYAVGGGLSTFDMDWGGGRRMLGITGWGDWNPPFLPDMLHGLSFEVEIRDIDWARGSLPSQLRMDTLGGGVLYHLPVHTKALPHLDPYIKALASYGSFDFNPFVNRPDGTPYSHDSRTVGSFGGGLDYRLPHGVVARFDYEYQAWPHLFYHYRTLDSNGYTFGALYSFGGRRRY